MQLTTFLLMTICAFVVSLLVFALKDRAITTSNTVQSLVLSLIMVTTVYALPWFVTDASAALRQKKEKPTITVAPVFPAPAPAISNTTPISNGLVPPPPPIQLP